MPRRDAADAVVQSRAYTHAEAEVGSLLGRFVGALRIGPTSRRSFVEAELGRPIGQVYASVDETPLAAASIAQVHPAGHGPERGTVPYHTAHPTGRR